MRSPFFSALGISAVAMAMTSHASPTPTGDNQFLESLDISAPLAWDKSPVVKRDQCSSLHEIIKDMTNEFCITYLSIPLVTATATVTSAVSSGPVTTTITATPTTSTSTIYSSYTPGAAIKEKRQFSTLSAAPPYPSSQVSEACSCLSIPKNTTTVTTTVQTTLPVNLVTVTATATPSTTTITTARIATVKPPTKTLPALCAPSILSKRFNSATNILRVTSSKRDVGVPSRADCCAICFNTPSCLFFSYYETRCFTTLGTDYQTLSYKPYRPDLCPNGVHRDSRLEAETSEDFAFGYGPCTNGAPL
ncbi:MAG: hypothetical protein M1833_005198 [Piccolia ochrophora]|nr:MAG: hypothetical protein M1833_005198 [Piccolia ochrophora]